MVAVVVGNKRCGPDGGGGVGGTGGVVATRFPGGTNCPTTSRGGAVVRGGVLRNDEAEWDAGAFIMSPVACSGFKGVVALLFRAGVVPEERSELPDRLVAKMTWSNGFWGSTTVVLLLYSTAEGMGAPPGLGEEATVEVTDAETLEASPEATELLMVRLCVLCFVPCGKALHCTVVASLLRTVSTVLPGI